MGQGFSLATKGLILVSIPVCFEIAFVWGLVSLHQDTELQAQQVAKCEVIEAKLNTVTTDMYEFWRLCYETNYQSEEDRTTQFFKSYKSAYLPLLRKLKDNFESLAELTRDEPEINSRLRDSAKKVELMRTSLDEALFTLSTGPVDNLSELYHQKAKQLLSFAQSLTATSFSLSARYEHKAAELNTARQSEERKLIVGCVLLACALNALFCVILALVLVRGIIARIAILRDNSRLLAVGARLNAPISGHDEIAELDQAFHRMADTLEETARAKEELVSVLTHDLRSPLTAIQGSLEIIDNSTRDLLNDHQKGLIKLAERNGDRMMRLINDLLDIHKIQAGMMHVNVEQVCLTEVFEEVELNVSAWIAEYGIKLRVVDTDLFVQADREKLERVIFNLVSNAIKFSPAGSTIKLSAKDFGHLVHVSVSDQGKGIPGNQLQNIFKRFEQVDSKDGKAALGSGLGLSICQNLIELQKGKIWVESEVGAGSTFSFSLPLA